MYKMRTVKYSEQSVSVQVYIIENQKEDYKTYSQYLKRRSERKSFFGSSKFYKNDNQTIFTF